LTGSTGFRVNGLRSAIISLTVLCLGIYYLC
jgi:hypothetical protein